MSQLNKLYQTMANLKELGLKINEDLVEEVNKLEVQAIMTGFQFVADLHFHVIELDLNTI